MRPWIKRTLFGLVGASLALGALGGCSHRWGGHGEWSAMSAEDHARFRERMVERIAGKLALDEAQKKKLAVVADKLHEQRQALHGGTDPRADIQSLVAGPRFDRAKAQALVADKTAAVQAKGPEVVAALGDFYDSLTPAQQAQVREFMQRRHGRWRRG